MKYKVGDKVKLKSKEWFDENVSRHDIVNDMRIHFGNIVTIRSTSSNFYLIEDERGTIPYSYYDFCIECSQDESELNMLTSARTYDDSAGDLMLSSSIIKKMDRNVELHKFYKHITSFTSFIDNDGSLNFIDNQNEMYSFEDVFKKYINN